MSEEIAIVPKELVLPSGELVLPSGELVDLSNPSSRAYALSRIRDMEQQLKEVKGAIVDAFAEDRARLGVDEIELEDGSYVKVKRNYDIAWDHVQLEKDLREAGMPEERIREIIVEEVSWTVKTVEANKAAKRNAEYAKAVASARSEVEKRPTISLPRG